MARYNEILSGRFNRSLQKIFGMKGEPPAPQLGSEISVNHQLGSGVENRYMEGWERFSFGANLLAVAAQTLGIRIRNPAGSNCIAVIEKMLVGSQVVGDQEIDVWFNPTQSVDLATGTLSSTGLDNRHRGQGVCICSYQTTTVAGLSGRVVQSPQGIGSLDLILTDNQELTLLPNSEYTVASTVANKALSATFWWRERGLEESERT